MKPHPRYSTFRTDIIVRPDDIDMNGHVHNSRYLDYVLTARYDQMRRCYGMSMEEFVARGFGWVATACYIEFKRELVLGDIASVATRIEEIDGKTVKILFEIVNTSTGKIASDGYYEYTLIDAVSGRAVMIPPDIIEKYTI
jgi:YbgC/YbaW family acyl-CoA thioester hydrolase